MEKYQAIWGANTGYHGLTTRPNEVVRFLWAFNLTPREYTVLLILTTTNSFEREISHEPAYISQTELGSQLGVTQGTISQTYQKLTEKKFCCPFCKYTQIGYIHVEAVKEGADYVWTCLFKSIVNHLAKHYNDYMEIGLKGREQFKQVRDAWLHDKIPNHLINAAQIARQGKQTRRRSDKIIQFRRK